MPTKIRALHQHYIGSVPYTSVVGKNAKGRYIVSTKVNGKEVMGEGDTERLATIDLRKSMDKLANEHTLPTR